MTASSARWQFERLSPEAREAAEVTALRDGVPLATWLAQLIVETCAAEHVELPPPERPREANGREPGLSVVSVAAPSPAPAAPLVAPATPSLFKQMPAFRAPPRPAFAAEPRADTPVERTRPAVPVNPFARLAPSGATRTDAPPAAPPIAPSRTDAPFGHERADIEPAAAAPSTATPRIATPRIATPSAAAASTLLERPATPEPIEQPAPPAAGSADTRPSLSFPGTVVTLPIEALEPSGCGTRRSDDAAPADLVMSIATDGPRQPLLVRRAKGGGERYEIVAGLRRWHAAQRIGLAQVPAIVADLDDGHAVLASLNENLHRGDLPPLDEARAYLRLMTQHALGAAEVTETIGRDRQHVVRWMRLLGLPPRVREHLEAGRLSTDHAFLLLGAARAEELGDAIAAEGLSLEETKRRIDATSATERSA